METLILGKGYVGSALSEALKDCGFTNRKKNNPGSIAFDLKNKTTWKNIPKVKNVVWTFPATPVELVQEFYHERLSEVENLIVLGSTSRYVITRQKERITEDTKIDKQILRVQGEEFLVENGGTLLCLAGIYGPNRDPKNWLYKNLIKNPNKLVNLVHLDDIIYAIKHLLDNPAKNERFNLADGNPKSWREIGEKCDFHFRMPGERELSKVIISSKIKSRFPKDFKFKELFEAWE